MKFKKRNLKSSKNTVNIIQSFEQGVYRTPVDELSIKKSGEYKTPVNTPAKLKKPIYKRPWFIALIVFVAFCILISVINGNKTEKIVWSDMVLGSMLPEPPSDKGELHENSKNELWVDVYKVSEKQYSDYITACETKGFDVDAENEEYSYIVYNVKGYKLDLSYYDEKLSIYLSTPLEMDKINWPTSKLGELLPVPKSDYGNFSYETDTDFEVCIAEISIEDYRQYVEEVQKAGFNVDYNKSKRLYNAENVDGYSVTVKYEGFNIMRVNATAPDENDSSKESTTVEENTSQTTTQTTTQITTDVTTTTTALVSTTSAKPAAVSDTVDKTTKKQTTTKAKRKETTSKKKKSRTVYTTSYGEKYHYSKSCAGKNASATELDNVKGIYDPCKKCVG